MKYQGAFFRIVGFAGKRFLFSPPPPSSTFFFPRFRSYFRAITRLETLATQAILSQEGYKDVTLSYNDPFWGLPVLLEVKSPKFDFETT